MQVARSANTLILLIKSEQLFLVFDPGGHSFRNDEGKVPAPRFILKAVTVFCHAIDLFLELINPSESAGVEQILVYQLLHPDYTVQERIPD